MKFRFGFITFLILAAALFTYLSLPKVVTQKEVTKEVNLNVQP